MGQRELSDFLSEAGICYRRDEPLSDHCTFAIGGPAPLFIEPAKYGELKAVIDAVNRFGVRSFILGNGSNVLFADEGFDGAVIHIRHGFTNMRMIDDCTIECECGASLKILTQFALENKLSGLEFAYGIPGSVGGGIYMNAGAYNGEMKDVLTRIYHIDEKGQPGSFSGDEMQLGYRHSAYTGKNYVITKALFTLKKGDAQQIRDTMEDYMRRRREKQPLDIPSAGSTFKRPVGGYAATLIDQCGLKGKRIGGAAVSEKHAGFVVNAGGATCKDVLDIIALIKDEVKAKTGVELYPEVRVVR